MAPVSGACVTGIRPEPGVAPEVEHSPFYTTLSTICAVYLIDTSDKLVT